MFPLRGIGTMPFPSDCALGCAPCAQATAGSEATVAPETAVLSKSRRVKLFIADRVYSRTIILQTFSRRKACVLPFLAASVYALNRGVRMKTNRVPLALALNLIVVCAIAAAEKPAMFRRDPAHAGVYDSPGVPQPAKVKWQFHTDGQVVSSPAVTGDTVYVGSSYHFLYAIDRASGSQKWKFKSDGRITSSPAVDAGTVYFGSYDGNFYAVDASTGAQKWKFALPGERRFAASHLHGAAPIGETMPDPFDFYLSSPVVVSGVVYVGSGDTNIYALDAASGQLKWKFKTGDVVHASPAIAGGKLYVGSWDSYFYALDAVTGKEIWRFKTGEDHEIHNQVGIQSSAAVADGTVYFGCRDSNFYAPAAAAGKERGRLNNRVLGDFVSPAVANGKVYFGTSDTAL